MMYDRDPDCSDWTMVDTWMLIFGTLALLLSFLLSGASVWILVFGR